MAPFLHSKSFLIVTELVASKVVEPLSIITGPSSFFLISKNDFKLLRSFVSAKVRHYFNVVNSFWPVKEGVDLSNASLGEWEGACKYLKITEVDDVYCFCYSRG